VRVAGETEEAARPRVRPTHAALVLVASGLAAVAYTYPLVLHFGEAIPYGVGVSPEHRVQGLVPGDQLQFLYFLSVTDDMMHGHVPWFEDPYEFSAPRPSTRRSFFFLPFSLLFCAFAPLGQAAAYNLLLLASFPATALSTFLLARRLGADDGGAAVAAAAVTLLPYRLANVAGGHPTGVAFFLLPLAIYFLEVAWQAVSRGAALGAGLCLVCLALNEPHFLYFFVFLFPLWLLFAIWRLEPTRHAEARLTVCGLLASSALGPTAAFAVFAARRGTDWTPAALLLLFAAFLALVALAWRVTAEIRARAGEAAWSQEARSYLPLALLTLYAFQLALGQPHLGIVLGVATVAVFVARKLPAARAAAKIVAASAERWRALWPFALGFIVAAFLLLEYKRSFIDPSGHGAGRSLREIRLFAPRPTDFLERSGTVLTRQLYPGVVVVALAIAALARREGRALAVVALGFAVLALGPNAPLWLPFYPAAARFIPFFAIIRQPAKFFAVSAIALALAAGIGTAVGRETLGGRWRTPLACAALGAVLLDFSSVLPFGVSRLPRENRAYAAVAERARGSNLLELALWPGDSAYSSIYQYWATRTRVPTVNGYSPSSPRDYVERVAQPLASMNLGELTEDQFRLLDDLEVRFVTVHRDTYPPQVSSYSYRFTLAAMRQNPNLSPVAQDDGVYLFERIGGPYRPWVNSAPWPIGVFYEAENLNLGGGERLEDRSASGGVLVRGRSDAKLPIVYGPYRPFPAGAYEVRFRARGSGRVEVTSDLGTRQLGAAEVERNAWTERPVVIAIDRPTTLEFRAWAAPSTGSALDVDWVLVRKLAGPEERATGPRRFEAEDMPALYGLDYESADASGDAYASIVEYPPGAVVRDGPYRLFGPGRVDVAVRFRGGPLRLRVEAADGRPFAESEIPARRSWATAEASVDLPERTVLCTRLLSAGAEADVDYVEITEREAQSPSEPPKETADGEGKR
jgi:hypothetical protein